MGMPRKGSRRVVVAGRRFLWRVKSGSGYSNCGNRYIRLTVQEDVDRPGRVMQAEITALKEQPDVDWIDDFSSLRPADVEALVRAALGAGWNPERRGPSWWLNDPVELAEYKVVTEGR